MIPETEQVEHGGADCRECPAYDYCDADTIPGELGCRDMLKEAGEQR